MRSEVDVSNAPMPSQTCGWSQVPSVPSRHRLLGFLAQRLKASAVQDAPPDCPPVKDGGSAAPQKGSTPAWSVTSEASEADEVSEKDETPPVPDERGAAPEVVRGAPAQVLTVPPLPLGKSGLRDWLTRLTGAYSVAGAHMTTPACCGPWHPQRPSKAPAAPLCHHTCSRCAVRGLGGSLRGDRLNDFAETRGRLERAAAGTGHQARPPLPPCMRL